MNAHKYRVTIEQIEETADLNGNRGRNNYNTLYIQEFDNLDVRGVIAICNQLALPMSVCSEQLS